MLIKNTHWTYCTQFSQSYKTLLPLLTLSAPPWAHCTPWKKKRQRGTLLSCQLMINGSASHLHRHSHNVPQLTTHTLFHCSKGDHCWARGAFRHCVDVYFACNLAQLAIQNILSCPPQSFCISLMTPSALISLVCSKHLCIYNVFMCYQKNKKNKP